MSDLKVIETKTINGEVFRRRQDPKDNPLGETTPYSTPDPAAHPFDELLWDFDIDWDALKTVHKTWLNKVIDFIAKSASALWVIRIDGYTSSTGGEFHNGKLSELREKSVETYLRDGLKKFAGSPSIAYDPDWHGFTQTKVVGEHPRGRSVRVAISKQGVPPPPAKALPIPNLGEAGISIQGMGKDFKIKFQVGLSGTVLPSKFGLSLNIDVIVAQIWNWVSNITAYYIYLGEATAWSPPLKTWPPVSVTLTGDWSKPFTTVGGAVRVTDFGGHAAFGSIGALKKSRNAFTMWGLPAGITHFPSPIMWPTGITLGVGADIGNGRLILISKEQKYSGP